MSKLVLLFLFIFTSCFAREAYEIKNLWNRLDPASIPQGFAFYDLYPESVEGKKALQRLKKLLGVEESISIELLAPQFTHLQGACFTQEGLQLVEKLAYHLPNRRLKGYFAKSEAEVLALPPEEIDLGKALLFSQLGEREGAERQAREYSALLDLMALEILAYLPEHPTPMDKIVATNRLIFEEMGFRFPPHSIYAKDIDLYTFLPSVMDNHLGVCLGVAALYLAVAQRIDLPLEAITPPGHIYVRYREGETCVNIETTARGIDLPTEHYLNMNTYYLPVRGIKEVVGFTHVNEGSLHLQNEEYEKAIASYQKAFLYLPEEILVKELLGFCYLFTGKKEEGEAFLRKIPLEPAVGSIKKDTMVEDYFNQKVDEEGLKAVFMMVDETLESVLKKQKRLQRVVKRYPEFREGLEHLAVTWVQMRRPKEALQVLEKFHAIDPTHPTIEYYLAVLQGERHHYAAAWDYLHVAEKLTLAYHFSPKALKELRQQLLPCCPE